MKQAAAGRAVMAGAEGERRLDLDRNVVGAHPGAVMRAVDEKAPGAHRRKPGERIGDPVALRRAAEFESGRRRLARRRGDEVAQQRLVGRKAEIDFDHPGLAASERRVGLEGRGRGLRGLEALDDEVRDRARARLVTDETHHVGGVVGRQAFEHRAS